ncbi:MAG: hypothetical protein HY000_00660 [Planctomycetes bacterium]|nr:hypothetical protein [Planctomycetota bacterium]
MPTGATDQSLQSGSRAAVDATTTDTDVDFAAEPSAAPPATSDGTPASPLPPPADGEPAERPPAPAVEPTPSRGSPLVPIVTAAIARLWARSGDSIQDRIGRTAESVEQLAAAAARTQELFDQQQMQQPVEPAPLADDATPPEVKTARSTSVLLINPAESGGVIHYLVDGASYSLHPGQMHQVDGERKLRVEFHRGDNHGDAVHDLNPGTYVFQVTAHGWALVEQPAGQHDEP